MGEGQGVGVRKAMGGEAVRGGEAARGEGGGWRIWIWRGFGRRR